MDMYLVEPGLVWRLGTFPIVESISVDTIEGVVSFGSMIARYSKLWVQDTLISVGSGEFRANLETDDTGGSIIICHEATETYLGGASAVVNINGKTIVNAPIFDSLPTFEEYLPKLIDSLE